MSNVMNINASAPSLYGVLLAISKVGLAAKYVSHVLHRRVIEYMKRKGFSENAAKIIANEALRKKKLLEKVIADEKYGLKEEKLGHPGKTGLYTGLFYIAGAIIPLIPYYLKLHVQYALPLSFTAAALLLATMDFIVATVAEISIKRKMLEMILTGLGSAALTFLIGKSASLIFGISVE